VGCYSNRRHRQDGYFVRLFKGQQLNICALVDTVGNKQAKIDKLVAEDILKADEIVKLAEFTDATDADIEDLFAVDFYLGLVQAVATENPPRVSTLQSMWAISLRPRRRRGLLNASMLRCAASSRKSSITSHRRCTLSATGTICLRRSARARLSGQASSLSASTHSSHHSQKNPPRQQLRKAR
jgi:hypothetical protein